MTRSYRSIGAVFLLVGVALIAASVLYPFAVGGFVWGGKVEDGRYFVVSKGQRYTEVSEIQWRISQGLTCGYGWLPVMLMWIGLTLRDAPGRPKGPGPRPSTGLPIWWILGFVTGTGALAAAGCRISGVPWPVVFVTWVALWGCFLLALLHAHSTRPRPSAERGAAPDPAGM